MDKVQEKISERLKKECKFEPLKRDQRRVYLLNNVRIDPDNPKNLICPESQGVINSYTIMDYVSDDPKDPTMAPKTIFYVTGTKAAPMKSDKLWMPILGEIHFERERKGLIICRGTSSLDITKDEFLFFHPKNESMFGKPGHTRPKSGYDFHLVDVAKNAEDEIAIDREIRKAKDLIDNMNPEDVGALTERYLYQETINMDVEEKRAYLLKWANKHANVVKIKMFSEDFGIEIRKHIRHAMAKQVIKLDKADGKYRWAETGEAFHTITPGKLPEESLVLFLMTDIGEKVFESMIMQTGLKQAESKKEKALV